MQRCLECRARKARRQRKLACCRFRGRSVKRHHRLYGSECTAGREGRGVEFPASAALRAALGLGLHQQAPACSKRRIFFAEPQPPGCRPGIPGNLCFPGKLTRINEAYCAPMDLAAKRTDGPFRAPGASGSGQCEGSLKSAYMPATEVKSASQSSTISILHRCWSIRSRTMSPCSLVERSRRRATTETDDLHLRRSKTSPPTWPRFGRVRPRGYSTAPAISAAWRSRGSAPPARLNFPTRGLPRPFGFTSCFRSTTSAQPAPEIPPSSPG